MSAPFFAILIHTPSDEVWLSSSHRSHSAADAKGIFGLPSSAPTPRQARDQAPPSSLPGRTAGSTKLRQPPLEQAPLGLVVDQCQRTAVGVAGLRSATEAAEQVAPRRVQVAVVLEGEAIDDVEPRVGALLLGDRDGPAQLDDR